MMRRSIPGSNGISWALGVSPPPSTYSGEYLHETIPFIEQARVRFANPEATQIDGLGENVFFAQGRQVQRGYGEGDNLEGDDSGIVHVGSGLNDDSSESDEEDWSDFFHEKLTELSQRLQYRSLLNLYCFLYHITKEYGECFTKILVNSPGDKSWLPLCFITEKKDWKRARALLKYGANPTEKFYRQDCMTTVLHFVLEHAHPKIILLHLKYAKNVDVQDKYGRTPLEFLASISKKFCSKRVVFLMRSLFKKGAEIRDITQCQLHDKTDNCWCTTLFDVMFHQNLLTLEVIKLLSFHNAFADYESMRTATWEKIQNASSNEEKVEQIEIFQYLMTKLNR